MLKRFFSHQSGFEKLDHFNKKNSVHLKHCIVLPNFNRVFRPYFDFLFTLSLDIFKNVVTYVQCSFALYFVVIALHPM